MPQFLRTTFRQGEITIEARPSYCDRGNWVANVWPRNGSELARSLDEADGFPRYYFDRDRACLEMQAWLQKRGLCKFKQKIRWQEERD